MKYTTAIHSDVGIRRTTNQDSLLVARATTKFGDILLAAVCDGIGGLAMGEVASTTAVEALDKWFKQEMPRLLAVGITPEALRISWDTMVYHVNRQIGKYGEEKGASLGTTLVALLLVEGAYYILNVGDSRVYRIADNICQLTKDQTLVQREIDRGNMTREQALSNPQGNVLLQCVGASNVIATDFYTGTASPGEVYLLCSDGFRHKVGPLEMLQYLRPAEMTDESSMRTKLIHVTELNKERLEGDNISAIAVRLWEETVADLQ